MRQKTPYNTTNVNNGKTIISNKVSFGKKGFKCFTDSTDDEKVKPLFMMLPKMSAYEKCFDETKYMSFLIKYDELLVKYNKIWDKVRNSIKKKI